MTPENKCSRPAEVEGGNDQSGGGGRRAGRNWKWQECVCVCVCVRKNQG